MSGPTMVLVVADWQIEKSRQRRRRYFAGRYFVTATLWAPANRLAAVLRDCGSHQI